MENKNEANKNQEKDRLPKKRRWKYVEEEEEDLFEKNLEANESNQFEFLTESASNEETKETKKNVDPEFRFKLACYNLLAPQLLNMNYDLYKNINPYYLDWHNRKHKLFYQLQDFNADIYCFQEMQEDQFYEFFEPKLKRIGYKCYFKKRYGREKLDGCCICFKSKKFSLIKKEPVDFFTPQVNILNRENVGLILLLQTKTKKQPNEESKCDEILCVATTHILYNPKRGDCKLAQMQKFLAHLDRMAYKESIVNCENRVEFVYYPTILCGDFNFVNNSKLFEFVSSAKLENYKDLQINLMSGQFETRRVSATIGHTLLPPYLGISDQSQFKEEIVKRLNQARQVETNNNFVLKYDHVQEGLLAQTDYLLEDKYDLRNYCTFGGPHLSHPFDFKCVYSYQSEENKPEATTCIDNDVKVVDYIFYHSKSQTKIQISSEQISNEEFSSTAGSSSAFNFKSINYEQNISSFVQNYSTLKLTARLELFSVEHLDGLSLPTKYYPSDHFMLAAKFRLN